MQNFRQVAIAGLVAASLTGLSASVDTAEALPIAAPAAHGVDGSLIVNVQYGYYHHRRYYRPYGYYHRRAGVYRCGPYAYHTHLSRKACR